MSEEKCEMDVFPKEKPFFFLQPGEIIKQKGFLRLGKSNLLGQGKEVYIVEDQYTATRYKDYDCALEHYEQNIKIDEEIRKVMEL